MSTLQTAEWKSPTEEQFHSGLVDWLGYGRFVSRMHIPIYSGYIALGFFGSRSRLFTDQTAHLALDIQADGATLQIDDIAHDVTGDQLVVRGVVISERGREYFADASIDGVMPKTIEARLTKEASYELFAITEDGQINAMNVSSPRIVPGLLDMVSMEMRGHGIRAQ